MNILSSHHKYNLGVNRKNQQVSQSFMFVLQILSDELGCKAEDIVSLELNICDTQPSCLGGANNEFIFSGRLDNLASSFCALRALIDSCTTPDSLATEHDIRMIALFDNEEVPFNSSSDTSHVTSATY